jgi:hypothetical protein
VLYQIGVLYQIDVYEISKYRVLYQECCVRCMYRSIESVVYIYIYQMCVSKYSVSDCVIRNTCVN